MATRTLNPSQVAAIVRGQLRTVQQFPRLLGNSFDLASVPSGRGPVVLFPGYGTNDSVLLPLRGYLETKGYDTAGWGQGRNRGDVIENLSVVSRTVELLAEENGGARIGLVGFSLGGVFAREVARDHPGLVSCVVTFGTPLFADQEQMIERDRTPIDVPIVALHSKNDRVVNWRSSIDRVSRDVTNIEVDSSHAGLTIDPDVWRIVAETLAKHQPE